MPDRLAQYLLDEYEEHAYRGNIHRELLLERAQLYGSLITLINRENINNLIISHEELVKAGSTLLTFTPSEDKSILTISLKDVEKDVSVEK